MKAVKHAASGRYLMCKSLHCYLHLLYRSTFILLSAKCMLGLFRLPVIHRTLTWITRSLTCVRDHSYVCVYTQGLGTLTACVCVCLCVCVCVCDLLWNVLLHNFYFHRTPRGDMFADVDTSDIDVFIHSPSHCCGFVCLTWAGTTQTRVPVETGELAHHENQPCHWGRYPHLLG